ncbi:hypothetical protein NKJ16_29705 [Mesorhizobium sp. M0179]|uniref:hypothetical protein n=1 Tax=Mesorhizobium sp. M0179 TaxID=2956905 RepID=UPI00333C8EB1
MLHRLPAIHRQDGAGEMTAVTVARIERSAGNLIRRTDAPDPNMAADGLACTSVAVRVLHATENSSSCYR